MNNGYEIEVMPLSSPSVRRKVEEFLAANGLRFDNVDTYVAVTADDRIVAGGGLCGNVIKCVAVSEEVRSEGITNALVSTLISMAGSPSVKVFTKPGNETVFSSLGFRTLARADKAILMENGMGGLSEYVEYLQGQRRPGVNGVIVMNANPFTKGHRYLVEQAAAQVDNLYVIAVRENRSRFSYEGRKSMIFNGTCDIPNVTVCRGSDYVISAATFPTYFLKDLSDATPTHISLDLDLFTSHIAPALGATVRFAGSEPQDPLTRAYNEAMAKVLPEHGIGFVEIPRLQSDGGPVSASAVRKHLDGGDFAAAASLVPPCTVPYLLEDLAVAAMKRELELSPKPGLVDRLNSGSHSDMDYATMTRGINAVSPFFSIIAQARDAEDVIRIGKDAESAMMYATKGVNTHKGAFFCIGLAVYAAARLWRTEGRIEAGALRRGIMDIAAQIPQSKGTHGAAVKEKYGVAGALESARQGYPELFASWLPYCREHGGGDTELLKLLLLIISTLDDTNILHRGGKTALRQARETAAQTLSDFSTRALEQMNRQFVKARISPGGSADMLALTLFITTITTI